MFESALKILEILNNNGYEAYIVGGYVRDYLLNNYENSDIDITTNAKSNEILSIFEKAILTGEKYGTVTVIFNNYKYEITTFRKDNDYLDNRRPDSVLFVNSIVSDLERRDYTVNSLIMDKNKNIIDYFNAKDDIKNKIINAIGNPNRRYEEDSLRIIRGVYLVARYNFKIHNDTYKAMLNNLELLKNIPFERIYKEFNKIFKQPYLNEAIHIFNDLKIYKYINFENSMKLLNNNFIRINFDEFIILESLFEYNYIVGLNISNNLKKRIKIISNLFYKNHIDKKDLFNLNEENINLFITLNYIINNNDLSYLLEIKKNLVIKSEKDIRFTKSELSDLVKNKNKINYIFDDIIDKILNNVIINNYKDIYKYLYDYYKKELK